MGGGIADRHNAIHGGQQDINEIEGSTAMSTVGFIGLGAMGSRIAGRLLDSGNQVYGTNRTRSKAQPLIDRGLQWRDTPARSPPLPR